MDASRPHFSIEDVGLTMARDGAMLENALLCLDGANSDHLTFFSSPSTPWNLSRLRARQVFVSEEAYACLSHRFPKVAFLSAKYMRTMLMGNMEFELLPSGEGPGSAFLHIAKGSQSLLYVSRWSPEKEPHIRQMIAKAAKRIFWNPVGDPLAPAISARAECDRLLEWISTLAGQGETAHLLVNPVRDLPRLLAPFRTGGVSVALDKHSRDLAEMYFKGRENSPHFSESAHGKLQIHSLPSLASIRKGHFPSGRWATTLLPEKEETGFIPADLKMEERFRIFPSPTLADFLRLASEVGSREVIVSAEGRNSEQIVQVLQSHKLTAWSLTAPRTDTLF